VKLNIVQRRPFIDCPGDTIIYNCSIESNSENVHLRWKITFLGESPVEIMFDSSSTENMVVNDSQISAILIRYTSEKYIESAIFFTPEMRSVIINCGSDVSSVEESVLYNTSGIHIIYSAYSLISKITMMSKYWPEWQPLPR
jgi:hypothetical protein